MPVYYNTPRITTKENNKKKPRDGPLSTDSILEMMCACVYVCVIKFNLIKVLMTFL